MLDPSLAPLSMPPAVKPLKKRSDKLERIIKDIEIATDDQRDVDDFRIFIEKPTFRIDCTPLE